MRVSAARASVSFLIAFAVLTSTLGVVFANDTHSGEGAWFPAPDPPADAQAIPLQRLGDGRILATINPPQIYDPYTGEWSMGSSHEMFEGDPRWNPISAVPLDDEWILAFGGGLAHGITPSGSGTANQAAIYHIDDDRWVDVDAMHHSRGAPEFVRLLDGSILVIGGRFGSGASGATGWYVTDSAERFIPDENRWEQVEPMHDSRRGHVAVLLDDGRVVVIGGEGARFAPATAIEVFDPTTGDWEIIAELPDLLVDHTATLLPDGTILIAGGRSAGETSRYGDALSTAVLLDPETGEISDTGSLRVARANHQAALLPDSSVIVIGGSIQPDQYGNQFASVEIYRVESGNWEIGPPLTFPRAHHFTLLLDDAPQGSLVYVFSGGALRWAEVYYPEIPGTADRQPPPVDDDPAHRYFSVTGHYLSFGFKDFWGESGGLPVFGYPLTTEFDEFNPDLGENRTSQYFERQRFEYHPEHAGTPYEVQLGRLGFAEADQRDLLNSDAFLPVQESDVEADCRNFAETQHSVCGAFLDFWQSHGLNFGDAGVSFRESLALFGYPISEDFVDSETGLQTQYFERARFEFHPDNPVDYKVLLGRLGADIVDQRDW